MLGRRISCPNTEVGGVLLERSSCNNAVLGLKGTETHFLWEGWWERKPME